MFLLQLSQALTSDVEFEEHDDEANQSANKLHSRFLVDQKLGMLCCEKTQLDALTKEEALSGE